MIPKLVTVDPEKDTLDELLNSVDLSTYGLERTRLNAKVELDSDNTEFDPANSNPRGSHNGEEDKDTLDEILKTFNERWFQG